jgi:hypothetical protein
MSSNEKQSAHDNADQASALQDKLKRLIVLIAYKAGWLPFVDLEIMNEYLYGKINQTFETSK